MAQLSVRVPDEMKKQLEQIALADKRSVAFVVKEALQQFLDGQVECQKEE